MDIISTIKDIIFLSPARASKIFFECTILKVDDTVSVKFYPTNKWLDTVLPEHEIYPGSDQADFQELWQQTGLAVGSLEHFLKNNNYLFTVSEIINNEYIEVIVNV